MSTQPKSGSFSVRFDSKFAQWLDKVCEEKRTTRSSLIRLALVEFAEKHKDQLTPGVYLNRPRLLTIMR